MEEIEDLRWKKFEIPSDGFVCLVDWMGSDDAIVQAARVCYGAGTKRVSDDRSLIRYLMRHGHETPFEMCEVKFLLRVPMDAWRQMIRHRTASVNEYSTRYSLAIDSANRTEPNAWRLQSKSNRQGSVGFVSGEFGAALSDEERAFHNSARNLYQKRIDAGIAREQARKDLPLSTYTEAYWKIDLRNLFHFLELRLASDAQLEIRQYAVAISEIVKKLFPTAYEAFEDYRLNSVRLSAVDIKAIQDTLFVLRSKISPAVANKPIEAESWLKQMQVFFDGAGVVKTALDGWQNPKNRERDEFIAKAKIIGLLR